MNKVNPNEAPEGYVATGIINSYDPCQDCVLSSIAYNQICSQAHCSEEDRKDECNVIFIKNSTEFIPQHADGSNFQDELLKSIADDCGFIINNRNMQENIKEVEIFASKVFEAGVKFGKEQANKELN